MMRWCQLCGGEYVAGVLECVDCAVPLGDHRPLTLEELVGRDGERIEYEFEELAPIKRLALDEQFLEEGIGHAWDGTALVVRPEDEEAADELIDRFDEEDFLEADVPQLSYEVADLTDAQRAELVDLLTTAQIEFAWDEHGELVVLEHDEERVDAFLDAVTGEGASAAEGATLGDATATAARGTGNEADDEGTGGDDLDRDPNAIDDDEDDRDSDSDSAAVAARLYDDEEEDAPELLGRIFVAADRLLHDPNDHRGVLDCLEYVARVRRLALPFGFNPPVWADLVAQCSGLAVAIEDNAEDEDIIEQATLVRNLLHPYI